MKFIAILVNVAVGLAMYRSFRRARKKSYPHAYHTEHLRCLLDSVVQYLLLSYPRTAVRCNLKRHG